MAKELLELDFLNDNVVRIKRHNPENGISLFYEIQNGKLMCFTVKSDNHKEMGFEERTIQEFIDHLVEVIKYKN